ncbi:glycosyltransferase family 9 protein [bacterium]|nr:glycosyltransferase family 9 protein [bacterium]
MNSDSAIACLLFRRVGDSLLAIPAIRALRKAYPRATISVFAESQVVRVFQGSSHINRILDCGSHCSALRLAKLLRRESSCSTALDFLSDPRSALACFLSGAKTRAGFAGHLRSLLYTARVQAQNPLTPQYSALHKLRIVEAVGARDQDLNLEFHVTAEERQWAEDLARAFAWRGKRIVAIFPTSRRTYKCWPLEYYAKIFHRLNQETNVVPILIGAIEEESELRKVPIAENDLQERIVLCDGIGRMAALLESCSLLLGNDGGPKHLACAVNTPTLTVFRHDLWQYWTPPHDPRHIALDDVNQMLTVEDVYSRAMDLLTTYRPA